MYLKTAYQVSWMGFLNIVCFISSSVLIWQYFRAGASRIRQLPATRHLFWHPHARPVYHHANRPERCCVKTFENLQEFIRWNHWSCWNWLELVPSKRRHLCFSSFDLLTLSLVSESSDEFGLKHLACNVYYEVLRHLPAVVRNWFNNQDRRAAAAIDRYL